MRRAAANAMFGSLLYRARDWPLAWRSRLAYYWFTREKENLGFFVMLAAPFAVLASLFYFAYAHGIRIDLLHQREAIALQRSADLQCLAENIYHEARGEPVAGLYAVAEVTLNRVASPYFPDTICEVVHEKRWDRLRKRPVSAFSWTEFDVIDPPRGAAWKQAMDVATAVYDRSHTPRVDGALFYHATYIEPYWARTKRSVATIGNHIFYR